MSARYAINFNKHGEGFVVNEEAEENLPIHNLVYRNAFGTWSLADADTVATMPVLGITMGAITTGKKGWILLWGYIGTQPDPLELPYWNWTVGAALYASTVAGELTETMPAGAGDVVQVVAIVIDSTLIQFMGTAGASIGGSNTLEGETAFVGFDATKNHFVNYFLATGTADDVPINAAVTYLGTGGHIYLEKGTYDISAPIQYTNRITFQGAARDVTILRASDDISIFESATPAERTFYVKITDMTLQLGNATSTAPTIDFLNHNRGNVENVLFWSTDAAYYWDIGINIESTTGLTSYYNIVSHCVMGRCDTFIKIKGVTGSQSNDNRIVQTVIGDSGKANGVLIDIEEGQLNRIHDCTLQPSLATITGLDINTNSALNLITGTRFEGSTTDITIDATSDYNKIKDNDIPTGTVVDLGAGNVWRNNFGITSFTGVDSDVEEIPVNVADPDGNIGDHPAITLTDTADKPIYFGFTVPLGFQLLVSAEILFVPTASGNLRHSSVSDWGKIASGEAYNAGSDTIAIATLAVDQDDVEGVDFSSGLTGIAAGDRVGYVWTFEGEDGANTVSGYFLGVRIRYV